MKNKRIYSGSIRNRGTITLRGSAQSEAIGPDVLTQNIPIELADVCNALISILKHKINLFSSNKNLPESRTSVTKILCAIVSARRLSEKPKHGGIQYGHSH
jgi:hypothetical protein